MLIVVRNIFSVPVQEGMWGSGGPNPNDNGWVSEFGVNQYFRETCSVNPFCHSMMDQTGDTYKHPNSDEFHLSRFPVMLDAAEWWIFCHTFLLLEVPIPQTMDAFLRWVTGVVSDLLFWVVGIRGADALEGGGQTRPQVMDFGLVVLRFLMIGCGRDMFPHYEDAKYFSSDFYPWSVDSIGGVVTLGAGWAERLRRMLSLYMLCARNYLRIMWREGGWIGVPVVVRLGYDEFTWPLGVGTFREVWHRVFLPRTPIDFSFTGCLVLVCTVLRMVVRWGSFSSRGLGVRIGRVRVVLAPS